MAQDICTVLHVLYVLSGNIFCLSLWPLGISAKLMEMLATLAGQHANAKDSLVERTKNKRNP